MLFCPLIKKKLFAIIRNKIIITKSHAVENGFVCAVEYRENQSNFSLRDRYKIQML